VPLVDHPALLQPRHPQRDRLIVSNREDGSVMGLAKLERLGFQTAIGLYLDRIAPLHCSSLLIAVAIRERVLGIVELFNVQVGDIRIVYRVTPSQKLIVSDRRKAGAKKGRAADVPTLVTVQMALIPLAGSKERLMRIDEQHRVSGGSLLRRHRPHVRSDHRLESLRRGVISGSLGLFARALTACARRGSA